MNKLLLTISMILLTGCTIVGPGERGIRVSMGSTSSDVKQSGAYLWIPVLYGMANIDIQVQKSEVEASAASKDMQEINTHVAVNWSIDETKVVELYKSVGDESDIYQRIISPAVNEVMKSAVSQKTAEEVLTKRLDMKKDIDSLLASRLGNYGIKLLDVSIVNLTFSKEFSDAIERKQIAEQEAKQAEYLAQKATQEAKANVEMAKGQAESQRLLKSTITQELLQKMAIEKWNGQYPQVMGTGTLPFINITPNK